jgi:hypothetical protein
MAVPLLHAAMMKAGLQQGFDPRQSPSESLPGATGPSHAQNSRRAVGNARASERIRRYHWRRDREAGRSKGKAAAAVALIFVKKALIDSGYENLDSANSVGLFTIV